MSNKEYEELQKRIDFDLFKLAAYVDHDDRIDHELYDYYHISEGHTLIVTSFGAN